jgi:4-hydroxy-tetrahydrodipicolinate synthase
MKAPSSVSSSVAKAIQALTGIHAATVCPLDAAYQIDEEALDAHVARVTRCKGIKGLLINGHAGENAQLSRAEKRRVIEVVRATVGPDMFITSGVYSEASAEAAVTAQDAEAAGADALLVFPPNGWGLGQDIATVLAHHHAVADATELPLLLYQAPVMAGQMAYPIETLTELVKIPTIAGVKEGSWEIAAYEENRRAIKIVRPDLAVLGSGDEHLLVNYLIGTEGSQVSLAAIVPELIVALWDASAAGDWAHARALHDRLYPLSAAIYRQAPKAWATARLKACLKILGHLADDRMRPPIQPLDLQEYARLEAALKHALTD